MQKGSDLQSRFRQLKSMEEKTAEWCRTKEIHHWDEILKRKPSLAFSVRRLWALGWASETQCTFGVPQERSKEVLLRCFSTELRSRSLSKPGWLGRMPDIRSSWGSGAASLWNSHSFATHILIDPGLFFFQSTLSFLVRLGRAAVGKVLVFFFFQQIFQQSIYVIFVVDVAPVPQITHLLAHYGSYHQRFVCLPNVRLVNFFCSWSIQSDLKINKLHPKQKGSSLFLECSSCTFQVPFQGCSTRGGVGSWKDLIGDHPGGGTKQPGKMM